MLAPKCKICGHTHWASEPHTLGKSVTPLKVAQAAVKAPPKAKPKKKAAKR